jgi:hypothetical protein
MTTRPAQHYIISPPKNYTTSIIGLAILDKLQKEHGYNIWPKFVITKFEESDDDEGGLHKLTVLNDAVLPDSVIRTEVPELYTPSNNFCGDDMSSDYLFDSVNKDNHFVMLGYNETDDLDDQIHSILTFSIKKKDGLYFIYIDAICVNNVVGYRGAGYLIKTLINVGVSIDEISYIKLYSMLAEETLAFYKKLGFIKTGIKDFYMGQKLDIKNLRLKNQETEITPLATTLSGGKKKNRTLKKRKGKILKTFKKRKCKILRK